MKTLFLLLILSIFVSGCSTADFLAAKIGYDKKAKTELRLNQLKEERDQALAKQAAEISKAKDDSYQKLRDNFQSSTNWTYGASLASSYKTNKTRIDNLLDYRLSTALSFSPGPTPEAILEHSKLLKEELDESKITNEILSKRYSEKEKEAAEARAEQLKKEAEVKAVQEAAQKERDEFAAKIEKNHEELDSVNGNLLALKDREIENQKESAHLKRVMMAWFLAGAAACAIGAYFFRAMELAIGAAICAGIGIAIPFIKTWMIISALCAIVVVIGVTVYRRLHNEKGMANRALGTIQEIRNESEETYQSIIKPKLQDWFKNANGLHKKVEKRLEELNVK